MKLRNKLLPVAALSAVVATAAPIALTSCNKGIEFVDITKYDMKDAKVSTRTTELSIKQEASTKYYADEITKNPSIFSDDLKCYQKKLWKAEDDKNDTINKWAMSVTKNPTVGSISYSAAGTTFTWPTLSFDYSTDVDYKELAADSTSTIEHTTRWQVKFSCTYKNWPFTAFSASEGSTAMRWEVCMLLADKDYYWHLAYLPDWSYTFNGEMVQIDSYTNLKDKTNESYTTSYKRTGNITNYSQFVSLFNEFESRYPEGTSEELIKTDFIQWFGFVDFYSHYMDDIPHAAE